MTDPFKSTTPDIREPHEERDRIVARRIKIAGEGRIDIAREEVMNLLEQIGFRRTVDAWKKKLEEQKAHSHLYLMPTQ